MNIAIDSNKIRIKPSRGAIGSCQFCGGLLIAKCGKIYTWHWQHHKDSNCDTWKEHETDWHRNWKNKFPYDWQEIVVLNEQGEKHIADIKTTKGLVIEFQNSPISIDTITTRENFYGTMIWVVNAKLFEDNMIFTDVVETRLKEEERLYEHAISEGPYVYRDEINKAKERLQDAVEDFKTCDIQLDASNKNLKILNGQLSSVLDIAEHLLDCWSKNVRQYAGEHNFTNRTSGFILKYKEKFKKLTSDISTLQNALEKNKRQWNAIKNLEDITIGEQSLKIASYKHITSDNYTKFQAILKSSRTEFFMEASKILTKEKLDYYLAHLNEYDFAVDPIEAISKIDAEKQVIEQEIANNEKLKEDLKTEVRTKLPEVLKRQIEEITIDIDAIVRRKNDLLGLRNQRAEYITELESERDNAALYYDSDRFDDYQRRKAEITTTQKDFYHYVWKRERKPWQSAKRKVYFDFGEGYLFKRINDRHAKRISYEDFLTLVTEMAV